jgi:hypothetical protein
MVIVGFNLVSFHSFAKIYAVHTGFIKAEEGFHAKINADSCALLGVVLALIGIIVTIIAFVLWGRQAFGELDPERFMRITIPAMTLILVGVQLVFSGFFIDILRIKIKE